MDRKRNSKKLKQGTASKGRAAAATQPANEEELKLASPRVLWLCYVGIPVATILFVIGVFGVAVLLDGEHQTKWYSRTAFGSKWRSITEKNPFTTTVFVNGGGMTVIFLAKRLWEHHDSLRKLAARKSQ